MSTPRTFFPRVREAREALKDRSLEILESYLALAAEARAAGNLEVAETILWKLLDHMPAEDGTRILDQGASKKPAEVAPVQPSIQIGIGLGGMPGRPKTLGPGPTVTMEPIDNE